jgi:hypothetical protein
VFKHNERTLDRPLHELNLYYRKRSKYILWGVSEHIKAIQSEHKTGWTATFVCPFTKVTYETGTSRGGLLGILHEKKDGKVWYRRKVAAINAAAARAMDDIQYQTTGLLEPRTCEEDPSVLSSGSVPKIAVAYEDEVDDDEGGEENLVTFAPIELMVESSSSIGSSEEDTTSERDTPLHPTVEEQESADEEQEEYVISRIDPSLRPYERILQAVADTTSSNQQQPTAASTIPSHMPTGTGFWPVARLRSVIHTADTWVATTTANLRSKESKRKSLHRMVLSSKEESPHTLLLGKSMLARLAQANQSLPINFGDVGVDEAARRVLDVLWKTEQSQPDADAYSFYLLCLEGPTPQAIAETAEDIVQAMRDGTPWNDHILPKPNTAVINALIRLWAQLGGTTGRYNKNLENFQPNRESFLALLSSSSYFPVVHEELKGGFDLDFARQCIDRMKLLAKEDPTFQPDSQVYNAPLRWSGGSLGLTARPYARYIPFDKYASILKNVRGNDKTEYYSHYWDQAKTMDEWRQEMEREGVASIETYEALIQAWIRTRTMDGIQKAEEIAEKLLEDPKASGARLQTFHPIIATWLHVKHGDTPTNLEKWVNRLASASESVPGLRPDGRMIEALIAAHVWKQTRLLEDATEDKIDDDLFRNELTNTALLCSDRLEEHCSHFERSLLHTKQHDVFSQVAMFVHCIHAWQNVARLESSNTQLNQCLDELFRILLLFERTIQVTGAVDDVRLRSADEPSLQLLHLMANGQSVFLAFVTAVSHIHEAQRKLVDHERENNAIARSLGWIERIVRRTGEFRELEAREALSNSHNPDNGDPTFRTAPSPSSRSKLYYGDQFSYIGLSKENQVVRATTMAFLWQVIIVLRQSSLEGIDEGDGVRICLLVKEIAAAHETSVKLQEYVDELLDGMLLGYHQRGQRNTRRPKLQSETPQYDQGGVFSNGTPRKVQKPILRNAASRRRPRSSSRSTGTRRTTSRAPTTSGS